MKLTPKLITIHYAEIGLKGQNRAVFENKLVANIRARASGLTNSVTRVPGRILVEPKPGKLEEITAILKKIYGISWFAPVLTTKPDQESLTKLTKQLLPQLSKHQTFAVRVNRAYKHTKLSSSQLQIELGGLIDSHTDLKVDLDNPDITLHITLTKDQAHLYTQKIPGPGGLPVGSSGRILSLFSGGFDSIVSSLKLAKRGASVDLVHFHVFSSPDHVKNSKIYQLAQAIGPYIGAAKLHLVPYAAFQVKTLDLEPRLQKYELVTFRRTMVRVAASLAKHHNYQALVTGDSLGQVASQTMENIVAVDTATNIPIFRPLIGSDKVDIIDTVRDWNLVDLAAADYQDCCSIVSKHPATRANSKLISELEDKLDIDSLVQTLVSDTTTLKL